MAGPGTFTTGDLLTLVSAMVTCTWVIGRLLLKTRDGIRDTLRDLTKAIGATEPPHGLLGKIAELEEDAEKTKARLEEARDWMMEAGLRERRSGAERRQHLTVRKQGL